MNTHGLNCHALCSNAPTVADLPQIRHQRAKTVHSRRSAAHKQHGTVECTHQADRNDLISVETWQTHSEIAVRPPSCAAAQRGNASERKAFVDSEALGRQKGRAEAAVHESAAGWVVQLRATGDHQRQPCACGSLLHAAAAGVLLVDIEQ